MYLEDGERKLTAQNSPVCTTLAASAPRSTAARARSSAFHRNKPGGAAPRLVHTSTHCEVSVRPRADY